MTVEQYNQNNFSGLESGLDDFDAGDLNLPRLRILHAEGKFYNPQTEEEFDSLDCVILGFVKQRVMFDPVFSDDKVSEGPWCKSNDFVNGFPGEEFPWENSTRDQSVLTVTPKGNSTMPCKGCNFQEWGPRNPKTNKSTPPACNELHSYVVLYFNHASQAYFPAVVSFKSSSLKASQAYLQGFKTSGRPTFTVFTNISLTKFRKGMVQYSVAKFSITGDTPQENWLDYSAQTAAAREALRAEPQRFDDEDSNNNSNSQPAPQAPPAAPTPNPWEAPSDQDLIQGEVVQQAQAQPAPPAAPPAPSTAPPAPPAPPMPAPVAAHPAPTQAAPAASHAPQGRTRPPAAPAAPAPAVPQGGVDEDDDGMPF